MTLLKDLIELKTEAQELAEEKGKYSSYASWKAACRKADPTCWIEGDKDIAQAMIGPKPFKRGETFSIGEWDGDTGEVFPRPGSKKVTEMFANRGSGHAEPDGDDKSDVKESADYAKQLVRGEKAGPGLMNKLDHWFAKMIITKDKNRFVPAETALKQLRKAGFNEEQITLIRDAATKAANTAVETMHKKHGEEAVPRKYISALPSSFGVFDLYLNVSEKIHEEFAALMRKLFDAKIDKIKDKLNIVKEDTALQGLGKTLKPSAKAEEPAKTDVNTPPAEKAAADDAATDEPADVSDAPAENVEPEAAFKVGDIVKPLKGPHKGEPHEVIHVFDDGAMNIRPKDLDAKAVKYRLGAAKAQPDEVVLAEGQKQTGSLFSSVVQLTEAKAKTLDRLKKRAKDLSDQMDRIILDGGRILQNDPLNVEFQQIRREMVKMKKAGAK